MAAQYDCGDRHDGITIITLDDISAKAMNSMLQIIYHGTYSLDGAVIMSTARQSEPSAIQSRTALEKNHPGPLKDTLLAHAQVGNLAASYQLPELQTLAEECFSAARCKGTMLKPEEMIEIAGEVYIRPSENEGLHAIVLEMILEHADQYLNDCGFIDCIMKDECLQDLAMDILAAAALRLKEHSDEMHTCQINSSDLMKTLLPADNQRLHDQMAAKEDAANNRLNEETMKIKRECEERIMRIKLQAKDQDRLRCDQISDAAKKLTQADGNLASTKMELKALKTTQATSETKLIELEEQSAKAASDATILDLQNKNRHFFQTMQEYQRSAAGPQKPARRGEHKPPKGSESCVGTGGMRRLAKEGNHASGGQALGRREECARAAVEERAIEPGSSTRSSLVHGWNELLLGSWSTSTTLTSVVTAVKISSTTWSAREITDTSHAVPSVQRGITGATA
ncbi:hypothetical protein TI39_contig831g00020 [Zymoseptoria brevis]|uniref:BTB domain-containing protein n=1 Tax=Zymoseptoria brevis TaxID=1047168 RepID=A0A0F4GF83_9PEZI|nr:hypothetical protein TI39_contig831g00020 [Zymoseptoria brevis]